MPRDGYRECSLGASVRCGGRPEKLPGTASRQKRSRNRETSKPSFDGTAVIFPTTGTPAPPIIFTSSHAAHIGAEAGFRPQRRAPPKQVGCMSLLLTRQTRRAIAAGIAKETPRHQCASGIDRCSCGDSSFGSPSRPPGRTFGPTNARPKLYQSCACAACAAEPVATTGTRVDTGCIPGPEKRDGLGAYSKDLIEVGAG